MNETNESTSRAIVDLASALALTTVVVLATATGISQLLKMDLFKLSEKRTGGK